MTNENLKSQEFVLDEMERTKWHRVFVTLAQDWRLYVLLLPTLAFLFLFRYLPIYGILEAFKSNVGELSIMDMNWVGLYNFDILFSDIIFWQALRNTFITSMYGLLFGFPIPIIVALLFSEVKSSGLRSILQVAVYLPKFISTVVITSIIILWSSNQTDVSNAGLLTNVFYSLGLITDKSENLLQMPKFFRSIYQVSGVWEGAGYGSIVYFAAVMAISPTNYEAAKIDGASKMQQIRYVTFPGMAPTLTIMLIMRIGQILDVGYEKVILLYNLKTYETADVVSTYVYRRARGEGGIVGVGVAADIFNSIIAMCLVLGANAISRRVSDTALF